MSRVTNEIARAVAEKLVQSKKDEQVVLEKELQVVIRDMYIASLPKGLMVAYKTYEEWFDTCNQILLKGVGITPGYNYYRIGDALPKNTQFLELTDEQVKEILRLEGSIKSKKGEIESLRNQIKTALLTYRTYKNIEDNFPEAFVLLPVRVSTLPMINIKDIRCKLDKANC